jgi:uncharacterized damage-inducible protein DinB
MNNRQALIGEVNATLMFFANSTSVLVEADSDYRPHADMYSVAAHVLHVADTIDWFREAAFGKGWDMDFNRMIEDAKACTSLTAARERLSKSGEALTQALLSADDAALSGLFPANDPIFPNQPKAAIVGAIVDHTAHHRGALTVYARMLGRVPAMPYPMN